MGISRDKRIYKPKMINGLKKIKPLGFTATINFWDRSNETRTYDPVLNQYVVTKTYTNTTPIPCRVQPIRSAVQRFTAVDGTWTGHLLISMSYDDRLNIAAGSKAEIVSVSNNPSLLTRNLVVKEILDSDNAVEFTLLCEVDTELTNV